MRPKPELYDSYYAAWFKDPNVIAAYPYRPPYAGVAIEFLSELVTDGPAAGPRYRLWNGRHRAQSGAACRPR